MSPQPTAPEPSRSVMDRRAHMAALWALEDARRDRELEEWAAAHPEEVEAWAARHPWARGVPLDGVLKKMPA